MDNEEKSLFGWKMRLMQVEDDLYHIEKQKAKCEDMVEMWREKLKHKQLEQNDGN